MFVDDHISKERAKVLAHRIEKFWHTQGYPAVRAWVEMGPAFSKVEHFAVRSNLYNGLPPSNVAGLFVSTT